MLFDKPRELELDFVQKVLDNPETKVVVAVCSGKIVGMATIAAYYTLTAKRGVFEHFAVLPDNQGSDLATDMFKYSARQAKNMGITRLMWTSRPSKERANGFYRKQGLRPTPTNVYKYDL